MKNTLRIIILFLLCNNNIVAQSVITNHLRLSKSSNANSEITRCSTHEKYKECLNADPSLAQKRKLMEEQTQKWINENQEKNKTQSVITIPVVAHVVYRTSSQNISDAQIQSQIDVLNADYRKLNADTSNTPSAFAQYAADVEFEFCLATTDPNGASTTGITRTQTSIQDIGSTNDYYYTSLGGDDIWDRDKYMNIWICEISGGTLGYAYLPGTAGADYDGIVIHPEYFGTTGTVSSPYHLGRTATHEVGHWFNLEHIWGDDNGACSGSDQVSDTPDQADMSYGCNTFPTTDACTATSPGIMFMNYMDYSDDDCMNMFTDGQASRMLSAINLYRSGLISSNGCDNSSVLAAKFSASSTNIASGSSIDFTDQSSGSPTSWNWIFSGASPSSSTSQNPSGITYSTSGSYDVTLVISNGVDYDTLTQSSYITVYDASNCDTITNVPSTSLPEYYKAQGVGYISGHNSYEDMSKAEYFGTYPSAKDLTDVYIFFMKAEYGSSSSTVSVRVWDNTGNGGTPGSLVASKDVLISDIATDVQNNDFTLVTFDSPLTITDDFYLGVTFYYNTMDTVVIGTTQIGDVTTNTCWEQWNDASWHSYASSYNSDLAHFIYPVFCESNVSTDFTFENQSFSVNIFPNPSKSIFHISISEKISSLEVYDILGNKIYETSVLQNLLDLSGKSKGIYFLHLKHDSKTVIFEKLIVN
jgi:PKD repeat protein